MSDFKHTPEPWYLVGGNKIYRRPQIDLYEYSGLEGKGVAGDKAIAIADKGWYGKDDNHFPHFENAARIVACVNACAGLPYPQEWISEAKAILNKVVDFEHPELTVGDSRIDTLLRFAKERDQLKAQRDELLAALELYMKRLNDGWLTNLGWREDTHTKMQQAINNAKGGQQ